MLMHSFKRVTISIATPCMMDAYLLIFQRGEVELFNIHGRSLQCRCVQHRKVKAGFVVSHCVFNYYY